MTTIKPPVVWVGNFRPSWGSEHYLCRCFEDAHYLVIRCQEDESTSEDVIQLAAMFEPELVMYSRTWGLKDGDAGGFRLWETLRRKGITSATFTLDLPVAAPAIPADL